VPPTTISSAIQSAAVVIPPVFSGTDSSRKPSTAGGPIVSDALDGSVSTSQEAVFNISPSLLVSATSFDDLARGEQYPKSRGSTRR